MRNALEKLIELQKVDGHLQSLEAARGDLPQRLESLKRQVEMARTKHEEKKNEIQEREKRKREINNELDALTDQLRKYQSQLYQVKTNKEYDAITTEIETAQSKSDELEYEALVLDESQEQILNQSTELQKELEKLELELKNTSKSLDKMLLQTREEEETFLKKRELVTKGISRPILSTYDRIRKARGGVAIAMLKNGSCSECSSRIPPQRGLEIRMMDRLHFCEVCGRILVWRPEMDGTERA